MDNLLLVGVNHKVAPVEVRERLAFSPERIPSFLQSLAAPDCLESPPPVSEAVLLSTCNRTEFYLYAGDVAQAEASLRSLLVHRAPDLTGCLKPGAHPTQDLLYVYRGEKAVEHLMRVACGLDSLVLGENEILGQVKEASAIARQAGTSGAILSGLFRFAVQAGKRARSETDIGHAALSVATLVVELAEECFGPLAHRTALLVGAGKMSSLTARELVKAGLSCVLVANRTFERASRLARLLGENCAQAVRFDALAENLLAADIVICSTGAPHIVLHTAAVRSAMQARPLRPILVADLAVPRDADPEIARIPGVTLVDIDDLESLVLARHPLAGEVIRQVETLICQELNRFRDWYTARRWAHLIRALRDKAEGICQEQVSQTLHRLGDLTPEQQRAIQAMGEAIINKLLHDPITCLKEPPAGSSSEEYSLLVQNLFGLNR